MTLVIDAVPFIKLSKGGFTQQTRDIESLLVQCWASVVDGGPTLNQQWLNVSCVLGKTF